MRPGAELRSPIYDGRADRNQLLLATGATLTPSQLELLKRRGISQVFVHRGEVERITGQSAQRTTVARTSYAPVWGSQNAAPSAGSLPPTWKQSTASFLRELDRPRELHRNLDVLHSFKQTFDANLTTTENVFDEFAYDQKINVSVVTASPSSSWIRSWKTSISTFRSA